MTEKKPVRFLVGLGVYCIGLNLLWISYNSILLPLLVQDTTSEATKGLWLGVVSMVSILVGIAVNILPGVISDHSTSKWGRRTPAIVVGMAFSVAVVLAFAVAPQSLPFVFAGYLLLQAFGNVSSGAYQPLLVDVVPDNQRGAASGLQGFFTIVGAAIGFVVITALVSAGMMWLAFVVIAAGFLLTTVINSLVIRRDDKPLPNAEPLSLGQAVAEVFRVRTHVPGFSWFVGANFLLYMSISSFSSYGIYYLQTVLRQPDPVRAMGIAGVVGIVAIVAAAVGAGILSDRIGRRKLIVAADSRCPRGNRVSPGG
jgi:MFS family permease